MTKREHVWIVDDDRAIRWVLEKALVQVDMQVTSFTHADGVLKRLVQEVPDAVISDIRMPGTDGLSLLEHVHHLYPDLPVIIMTAYADLDRAVAAFQGGAFEYLPKPFDVDDVITIVRRAVKRRHTPATALRAETRAETPEIVGAAPAMQELFRAIGRLSRSNMTVLITGGSGTGKELVARVLADGQFYRVGGHLPSKVDVRVIAATHQDLEQRVKQGVFREDLFHRLNVIRLRIPPLRERREDIGLLAQHFLAAAARELDSETKILHPDTAALLHAYDWPGNVRELENVCRWLTVMAPAPEIHLEDLPPELQGSYLTAEADQNWESNLRTWADYHLAMGETDLLSWALPTFERILLEAALKKTGGHRQDAAKLLGWGRNTVTRKLKELGMEL
jgi:DNA-binding NtrC family response regulator